MVVALCNIQLLCSTHSLHHYHDTTLHTDKGVNGGVGMNSAVIFRSVVSTVVQRHFNHENLMNDSHSFSNSGLKNINDLLVKILCNY